MDTVGAYEAKTHLSKLLERVASGNPVTITKHGVPVAVLQPYDPALSVDVSGIIAELREFRRSNCLAGLSIRDMIAEGRR